jgi:hypothetical protein
MFFIQLCSIISCRISTATVGFKDRESSTMSSYTLTWVAVLALSSLFQEYSRLGFGVFSTMGGIRSEISDFFLEVIADVVVENLSMWTSVLMKRHSGIMPSTIQPYIRAKDSPNLVSPFHLIAQSLRHDYV